VVHRDLKPGTVMLTRSGAKLMDFGLARTTAPVAHGPHEVTVTAPGQAPRSEEPITAKGTVVGTFQYMAPEQLEGKPPDVRSDIWALGCVLYEMATGKRAFEGTTPASIISAIMRDEPRVMSELAPMAPPSLERAVRQCLAKDPDDRWQTAADLGRELDWIARAGSQAGVAVPVAARRKNRERAAWVLAVVAASLVTVWLRPQHAQKPVVFELASPAAVNSVDLSQRNDPRVQRHRFARRLEHLGEADELGRRAAAPSHRRRRTAILGTG
jgi:eukaryotic-like serine/threonine-protein kinase